jgi:hypothetical protein
MKSPPTAGRQLVGPLGLRTRAARLCVRQAHSTYGFCRGDPGEIGWSRIPMALTTSSDRIFVIDNLAVYRRVCYSDLPHISQVGDVRGAAGCQCACAARAWRTQRRAAGSDPAAARGRHSSALGIRAHQRLSVARLLSAAPPASQA